MAFNATDIFAEPPFFERGDKKVKGILVTFCDYLHPSIRKVTNMPAESIGSRYLLNIPAKPDPLNNP
jgi:hypothetical protein